MPGDWEAEPDALRELRRVLADEYGAYLSLRQSTAPLSSPLPLWVGYWERELGQRARWDTRWLIEAAFFSLEWLGLEDVG